MPGLCKNRMNETNGTSHVSTDRQGPSSTDPKDPLFRQLDCLTQMVSISHIARDTGLYSEIEKESAEVSALLSQVKDGKKKLKKLNARKARLQTRLLGIDDEKFTQMQEIHRQLKVNRDKKKEKTLTKDETLEPPKKVPRRVADAKGRDVPTLVPLEWRYPTAKLTEESLASKAESFVKSEPSESVKAENGSVKSENLKKEEDMKVKMEKLLASKAEGFVKSEPSSSVKAENGSLKSEDLQKEEDVPTEDLDVADEDNSNNGQQSSEPSSAPAEMQVAAEDVTAHKL